MPRDEVRNAVKNPGSQDHRADNRGIHPDDIGVKIQHISRKQGESGVDAHISAAEHELLKKTHLLLRHGCSPYCKAVFLQFPHPTGRYVNPHTTGVTPKSSRNSRRSPPRQSSFIKIFCVNDHASLRKRPRNQRITHTHLFVNKKIKKIVFTRTDRTNATVKDKKIP